MILIELGADPVDGLLGLDNVEGAALRRRLGPRCIQCGEDTVLRRVLGNNYDLPGFEGAAIHNVVRLLEGLDRNVERLADLIEGVFGSDDVRPVRAVATRCIQSRIDDDICAVIGWASRADQEFVARVQDVACLLYTSRCV